MMPRLQPLRPIIVALIAISLTPHNHAFSPRITLLSSPSSTLSHAGSGVDVGNLPARSSAVQRFQSPPLASSSSSSDEVTIDGRPLLDKENSQKRSFLKRLLFAKSRITIRGANKYGTANNSTILAPADAAIAVGVQPTLEASKETWQRAWRIHRFMMKVLHRFDRCKPKDSKLALACLWWKALAGNDPTSPVHDYQLSYDLLPPVTRWIVHRRLCRFYPRLHHANVEIRTAYLDNSVSNVINTILRDGTPNINTTIASTQQPKKIRLIVMGGGYDTRSMKLLERSLRHHDPKNTTITTQQHKRLRDRIPLIRRQHKQQQPPHLKNAFDNITTSTPYDLECYELDLPEVVRAKRELLQKRLFRRRSWLQEEVMKEVEDDRVVVDYPTLLSVDFNDLNKTRRVLEKIVLGDDGSGSSNSSASSRGADEEEEEEEEEEVNNIILFEGVMIYLDEGVPHSLLEICSNVLNKGKKKKSSSSPSSSTGYLCFADRLENIPGGDEDAANIEMEGTGWELLDWLPKPGLARHMGVARLKRE